MASNNSTQVLARFGLFAGILLFLNILSGFFHTSIDLTEEKRFTLTAPTKELLRGLDDRIFVKVMLEGAFPAGFKRLQEATKDILDDFRTVSGNVEYSFEDPNAGSIEDINAMRKKMSEIGVNPVNLRIMDKGEKTQKLIYPYAIVHFGSSQQIVRLLENETPTLNNEQVLNQSIGLLEYKLANAIKRLRTAKKPIVLFMQGHGELHPMQLAEIMKTLGPSHESSVITLDSVTRIDPNVCALLVVAKPRGPFSEKDKFKIDQYIMNGGKVLWLVDRLNAELDSLGSTGKFIPKDYPTGLEDMLFRYGVRIQPDLVLDLQSSQIPLRVGQVGNAPQLDLFKWYYHVAAQPAGRHPIAKNLDHVELKFCSSVDTLRTKTQVQKTVLLTSSRYSRLQFMPVELNFEVLKYDPDPAKFNKGEIPVAVLLEGVFPSNYQNRVSEEMQAGLRASGIEYRSESQPTAMLVVSDGDMIANGIRDPENKVFTPVGYNRYENRTYANETFLVNAIEYLTDPNGIIDARSKEVKLRLLDTVRADEQKGFWRFLNIGLPLVLLALGGYAFQWWRKRRYASASQP